MSPLNLVLPAVSLLSVKWDWWNLAFIVIVLALLVAAFYFRGREVNGGSTPGAANTPAGKGARNNT